MIARRQQTVSKPVPANTPIKSGFLQRKCACGNHTLASGECSECSKKRRLSLQTKLKIGKSDDIYEQEADQIADQVTATSAHLAANGVSLRIQRLPGQSNKQLEAVPTSVDQALTSPGRQLDSGLRQDMEQRFGYDFSMVRAHVGAAAEQSARDVNAKAYTVGHNIVFGAGELKPETHSGRRLIAHELTHVVQQGAAVQQPMRSGASQTFTTFQSTNEQAGSRLSDVIQRAGDPAAIPSGLRCPTDLTPGRPAGTDVLFPIRESTITSAHTTQLTTFRTTWLAAGGTDDILVHGYASTLGAQGPNWTLSCDRAEAVREELVRLGIPRVRINVVAHGESTDFSPSPGPNQHAIVSTSPRGIVSLPLITGVLTARDNFAGRSVVRFGVGETIDLTFFSAPTRPAADFGGLQWVVVSGGGVIVTPIPADGTGTYTAPATAGAVKLELRVATGATAGTVISTHTITIVIPSAVRMTVVPGSAPNFGGWGQAPIAAGTWGVGFRANEFINPKDVSFRGVFFSEGSVAGVVTPAGSFLSGRSGLMHAANPHGPGLGGNATTGTPVNAQDGIWFWGGVTPGSIAGVPVCGASDFLWAIPWLFSVAGGPPTPFAAGFTANQHLTSTILCDATVEKAGAGPVCRRINGTTC